MNLYVYTNKQGKVFYYVKHSYRDKNGKSTSRIVEKLGTHEELLARQGKYYELFETQAKYYRENPEGEVSGDEA